MSPLVTISHKQLGDGNRGGNRPPRAGALALSPLVTIGHEQLRGDEPTHPNRRRRAVSRLVTIGHEQLGRPQSTSPERERAR